MLDPQIGRSISHSEVATLIDDFRLPISAGRSKPIVAIALPNGPLLALTVLATATYYTAAPVAHGSGVGAEQFKNDVLQSNANTVLVSAADVDRLDLRGNWLCNAGIQVLLVHLSHETRLAFTDMDGRAICPMFNDLSPQPNGLEDIGILLFTSGTSGTKKLVPLRIDSMIAGVTMVVDSWGLSPSMRCLNQMPLNHVGGLIRNLFAPIMSGGSVICCSAFDANLFWDCVEDLHPTWYYASPSMHQCILEAGLSRPKSVAQSQIRLVCNAAGGLLPSLASQLQETFNCTVLPSYGMTECMPISTPRLDYQLNKPGTSGISVGPEIAVLDDNYQHLKSGAVGRINVRGSPLFAGYLTGEGQIDKSCFNPGGWFDTGDIGYLDGEGYLYITGRSKEVINRGGELISPFEIEEAVMTASSTPGSLVFGRVSKALAFSIAHDVLQEAVGIAVATPHNSKRTCLRDLQQCLESQLSQVKVPVLLVFMDGGLPINNNKVLRIRLAERLGLPTLSDSTPQSHRHYDAVSPPVNTSLSKSIDCVVLHTDHQSLRSACQGAMPGIYDVHIRPDVSDFYPELLLAPRAGYAGNDKQYTDSAGDLVNSLAESLHGYDTPRKVHLLDYPLPRTSNGDVDDDLVNELLVMRDRRASKVTMTSTETTIASIFGSVLSASSHEISSTSDFFELGGSSMAAGQLLARLRKEFQLRLPIDVLFTNSRVSGLAALIDDRLSPSESSSISKDFVDSQPSTSPNKLLHGCEETCESTRPTLMLVQLLPIALIYPTKRALTWTVFMYFLTYTQQWYTNKSIPGRLLNLVISMVIARLTTKVIAPLLAIAFKWIVVGRYQEGLYPMWSRSHTKWWFCQKVISIAGMGVYGSFNCTRVMYYRALGARIGRNVSINKGATLGEYDLITLAEGAVLERCTIRPFAAERNTSMYLGRINVGANASIGLGSIVAAGTSIPAHACIGPNSSSWEVDDADEANRDLAASKIPGAHWALSAFLGIPLQLTATFVGALPWLGCLVALVVHEPNDNVMDTFREVTIWFASPERVAYHYAALSANAALGPACLLLIVYVVKKLFDLACGSVGPSYAEQRSQVTKFRMQLMSTLMPAPKFHQLTELFGSHYEATSILARALGAKVGKRVYWPGTGPSIQNYSLLDIGDDVVFGSRAHLVTSDGTGSEIVRIKNGAMVADRVVLLPGTVLGEGTVMGSGALTKRNVHYASGTTWVGAKHGEAVCLTANVDATPAAGLGHRSSQYHETARLPPNLSSMNSTSTTLVKNPDCEVSSITFAEQGHGLATFTNRLKCADDLKRMTSVTTRAVDSDEPQEEPSTNLSPFGRAFYNGQAPYRVWGQFTIFCYSTSITILTAIYWNIGSISAVQIIGHAFKRNTRLSEHFLANAWFRPITVYIYFTALLVAIMAAQSILVLLFTIGVKWLLMGRRHAGNYDWDKSSYCQRWQLFLRLESLRRHCYGGHGILGLLTGTHWIVLYFRALGATIGDSCALFASGLPSLMFTEPDLLTLGDRVAVDDASLVAHINTRGKFDLNPLYVGDRSVLRSGSRLLSGARMEADTCLLEHTLVMAGDVVDAECTSQGWPAEEFTGSRTPTLMVGQVWVKA